MSWQPYDEWFAERVAGRSFRLKRGTTIYDADGFSVDDSYRRHYDYVTVRLVARTTHRAKWVQDSELEYNWTEVAAAPAREKA